jgi:signal transduction histidine kinase
MLMSSIEDREWPIWVPLLSATLVLIPIVTAVIQRANSYLTFAANGHVLRGHVSIAVVLSFAALAYLPFAVDVANTARPRVKYPLWLFPIPVLIGIGYFVFHPALVDFAPFVFVFMSAELAARDENLWIGISTAVACMAVMAAAELAGRFQGSFIWVMGILFGWFGGYLVRSLDRRTRELAEAQAGLAEKAAADERSRIAREVHDVIAHSMSVTMLHITAARMALENDKPDQALEALHEAERQGRSSMSDIRRTVGLLGSGDAAAPPMPGATDLPKLVNDFRAAGLLVDLRMDGDFRDLDPAAGLSLYRIVQESLTNAAKHSPGAETSVLLSIDDEKIHLTVRNASANGAASSGDGSGLGLRGMIERAGVLNGELTAGPTADGWTVELTAPR